MPAVTAYVVKMTIIGGAQSYLANATEVSFVSDILSPSVLRYTTAGAAQTAATSITSGPKRARLGDYLQLDIIEALFDGGVTTTTQQTLQNPNLAAQVAQETIEEVNAVISLLSTQQQRDALKADIDAGSITLTRLRSILANQLP